MGGPRRTASDLALVRELAEAGVSLAAISRQTGAARATLRAWLASPPSYLTGATDGCAADELRTHAAWSEERYAYLFGLYLGDGHISGPVRGVYKLRVSLDDAYPAIIEECAAAIRAVRPGGRVGRVQAPGCTVVVAYWKHWPCLFPQHGAGQKHLREMGLEGWQAELLSHHPASLLRGLIHSDGCRYLNSVRSHGRAYAYPTYGFTNLSEGIHEIFGWACDLLGVDVRHPTPRTSVIATRRSVAILDELIGPKR